MEQQHPQQQTGCVSLDDFYAILRSNPGVVVFKFGAPWCRPCQKISGYIDNWKKRIKGKYSHIQVIDVCVDDSFELYGQLRTKRMIQGIPALLAYKQGNVSYAIDAYVSGTNEAEIDNFFQQVLNF
jgi:thioredoxin-like negative regulator of GroEL